MMVNDLQYFTWHYAKSEFGSVSVDPELGMLRNLTLVHNGRSLVPHNTAHWVTDEPLAFRNDISPVEQRLSGDFFCAPFGPNDLENGPPHGWSANSHWTLVDAGPGRLVVELDRPVMGAKIEKQVQLSSDAPLLYQTHLIRGGHGELPVAHHPMVDVSGGARLFTSLKAIALTPLEPLEAGRNALTTPGQSNDIQDFSGLAGQSIDLTRLPIAQRSEDFVTLVEAPESMLGWSAIMRDEQDDIIFFLKNPRVLPITCLWHSNAGRDFLPWDGRHNGVLGVEDACAAGVEGHAAALRDNPISALGVPTALSLATGRNHSIEHVTGAIARPEGWDEVSEIFISGETLTISESSGSTISLPFIPGFLGN